MIFRTYVVEPSQLVVLGIGVDVALVVDVIAHLDVVRIQIRSHLQSYRGGICSGEVMVSGGVQEEYASTHNGPPIAICPRCCSPAQMDSLPCTSGTCHRLRWSQ